MKPKLVFTLIGFLLMTYVTLKAYSFNWSLTGPPGIKANKIRFYPKDEAARAIICIDSGMYVSAENYNFEEWEFFSLGNLPVTDVLEYAENGIADSLILVMGDGTYSDGIYSFNLNTHEFTVIHYCIHPKFVTYYPDADLYYVGTESGLLQSSDLINWINVLELNGRSCIDFAGIPGGESCIVLVEAGLYEPCIYSHLSLVGWVPYISFNEPFLDIASDAQGYYYALSINDGVGTLYRSPHAYMGFVSVWYSDKLHVLGQSSYEYLFLGWNQSPDPEKGVSRWYNGVLNISEGLPERNINSIHSHTGFVGLYWDYLYCCTDSGVYYCGDYCVAVPDNSSSSEFSIFPNPIKGSMGGQLVIEGEFKSIPLCRITDARGVPVQTFSVKESSNSHSIDIPPGLLVEGIYLLYLGEDDDRRVLRLIVK